MGGFSGLKVLSLLNRYQEYDFIGIWYWFKFTWSPGRP